ncbi:MAG: bifunctional ADP-dependent NAD(P)H-hydrate dehydratase/NAD(P)H-hydrate epimerase [Treponema sp.]|nr:bifunctional ADP-dependent NAD(P)H-hydrate dehydratase/NAD(P)H-hydrate epimerase [Treponema sp.]
MQKIFYDTRMLDKAARDAYGLTEDIMMENAAAALERQGSEHFFSPDNKYINRPCVLILSGGGNNGADGYALARRIVQHKIDVAVCQVYEPKSAMCVLQADRAKKAGAIFINPYDLDEWIERASFDLRVVYDCIFGSGFHGTLDAMAAAVIASANKIDGAYKIACDLPTGCGASDCKSASDSGIDKNCSQDHNAAAESFGHANNSFQDHNAAAFRADTTVTMGALKLALYSDAAKDACGKIVVADLGVSRNNFESAASAVCSPANDSGADKDCSQDQKAGCAQKASQAKEAAAALPCAQLLEPADARLPLRDKKQNSHKGTYGHTAIFAGTKPGAAVIAGHAALKFGSGLASLVPIACKINFENVADFELMVSDTIPKNATALVAGPGLGRPDDFGLAGNSSQANEAAASTDCSRSISSSIDKNSLQTKEAAASTDSSLATVFGALKSSAMPLVLDADIFYWPQIKDLLAKKKNVVLTPHPKEFAELLKNLGLGEYTVAQVVERRLELTKEFCAALPGATLLLKGANVLIASKLQGEEEPRVYINALGTSALAKGGSGDVLAGMIAALLAQGCLPLEAAVTASIAHASASHAFDGKDYSLTPFGLIGAI